MPKGISTLSDTEFLSVVDQLKSTLATAGADYPSITTAMKTALDTARDLFNDKLTAHVNAQAAAKSATTDKNNVRDDLEAQVRNIRNLCTAGNVDDAKMSALGLPSGSDPAPNATIPVVAVNTAEHLRHTLSWSDAAANGNKKKPRGAMGAEIWVKIDGPPPGSEKDCVYLALDSATPYLAEYDADDAGKTAHYLVRWHMRDGSTSAWAETVSATITG